MPETVIVVSDKRFEVVATYADDIQYIIRMFYAGFLGAELVDKCSQSWTGELDFSDSLRPKLVKSFCLEK